MHPDLSMADAFNGYRALLQQHLAEAEAFADRSEVLIKRQEDLVAVLTARGRDTATATESLRLARGAVLLHRQRIADMERELARLNRLRV